MLLRVYVDTPEQFRKWIENQQKTQESNTTPQSEGFTAEAKSGTSGWHTPEYASNRYESFARRPAGNHAGEWAARI
jgi:hypothetical protein